MILPTQESIQRRRRGYQRRGAYCAVVFVAMVSSVVLPHIGVREAEGTYGRSLFPASRFFLGADARATAFSGSTDIDAVAAGLNITYYGLSLQHLGLLLGVFTFWSLAAESVGRWTRRVLLIAGWLFASSAAVVLTGYQLLENANIPSSLGSAWACCLLTGVLMIIGGRAAKNRLDGTWYWSRPELNG